MMLILSNNKISGKLTDLLNTFKEFKEFTDINNHDYQFILYDGRTQDRKERLKVIKATEFKNLKLKK